MNHWDSQRYLKAGRQANKNGKILANAVKTAKLTRSANPNSPQIFTLGHLAQLAGVPYEFLRAVASRGGVDEDTFYRVFSLKKRSVGFARSRTRTICAPQPLLLKTQRWIHENVLKNGRFHEACRAYIPESRIFDAAELHCNARWMVKLDITNFFETISEQQVYREFRSFGYQPLVSFELARICTRTRRGSERRVSIHPRSIKAYDDKRLGHLPQGAPTSPLLANLVTFGLDVALTALAEKFDTVYTRYADDITFSSSTATWSRLTAAQLLRQGHEVLRTHGFRPNHTKSHIVPPGSRKIMLGLAVQDSAPRLTKDFKNKLRAHIYYLEKFQNTGTLPHIKLGFDSILGLQRHVFGLAYYAKGIERDWGELRLSELKALSWPTDNGILFD